MFVRDSNEEYIAKERDGTTYHGTANSSSENESGQSFYINSFFK